MTDARRLILLGCSVAIIAACSKDVPQPPPSSLASSGLESCFDNQAGVIIRDSSFVVTSDSNAIETARLAGVVGTQQLSVPGRHDCQRFIATQGQPAYQQLVAIFAVDEVNAPFPLPTTLATPIAVVYNYGETYAPLKIRPGYNCLYAAPATDGYSAWMKPVGDVSTCVQVSADQLDPVDSLIVSPRSFSDLGAEDYVRAAKWDTDPGNRFYYIQIPCDEAIWCRIHGNVPFTPSQDHPDPGAASSSENRRRILVKGWYDEQRLASALGPTGIAPTMGIGTTFPDPQLSSLTDSDFAAGWQEVGRVFLYGAPPTALDHYQTKLGLAVTGPPPAGLSRANVVWICDTSGGQCQDASSLTCPSSTGTWRAKVVTPDGAISYHCVRRHPHDPSVVIPGTSRWRFKDDDELLWYRCGFGCCEYD